MVSSVKNRSQQRHILSTLHNEIDLLRRLDHPNIIRAYEAHEVGKDLHLIMELCRGGGELVGNGLRLLYHMKYHIRIFGVTCLKLPSGIV